MVYELSAEKFKLYHYHISAFYGMNIDSLVNDMAFSLWFDVLFCLRANFLDWEVAVIVLSSWAKFDKGVDH